MRRTAGHRHDACDWLSVLGLLGDTEGSIECRISRPGFRNDSAQEHPNRSKGYPTPEDIEEHLTSVLNPEDDFRWASLRELIRNRIEGSKVLDAGCGTGHAALDLLSRGYEVTAIDSSPSLVRFTQALIAKRGFKCDVRALDLARVETIKRTFDTVLCLDVLEHVMDDSLAIAKMRSILKTRGRLIVSVPALKSLYGLRDIRLGHLRRYAKNEFKDKLTSASFDVIELRYWNFAGLFPLAMSTILAGQSVMEGIRYSRGALARAINKTLRIYFEKVENSITYPVGATLLAVCEASSRSR